MKWARIVLIALALLVAWMADGDAGASDFEVMQRW